MMRKDGRATIMLRGDPMQGSVQTLTGVNSEEKSKSFDGNGNVSSCAETKNGLKVKLLNDIERGGPRTKKLPNTVIKEE